MLQRSSDKGLIPNFQQWFEEFFWKTMIRPKLLLINFEVGVKMGCNTKSFWFPINHNSSLFAKTELLRSWSSGMWHHVVWLIGTTLGISYCPVLILSWRCTQQVAVKHLYLWTRLFGNTSRKAVIYAGTRFTLTDQGRCLNFSTWFMKNTSIIWTEKNTIMK